jgi:hypothetical protein
VGVVINILFLNKFPNQSIACVFPAPPGRLKQNFEEGVMSKQMEAIIKIQISNVE